MVNRFKIKSVSHDLCRNGFSLPIINSSSSHSLLPPCFITTCELKLSFLLNTPLSAIDNVDYLLLPEHFLSPAFLTAYHIHFPLKAAGTPLPLLKSCLCLLGH